MHLTFFQTCVSWLCTFVTLHSRAASAVGVACALLPAWVTRRDARTPRPRVCVLRVCVAVLHRARLHDIQAHLISHPLRQSFNQVSSFRKDLRSHGHGVGSCISRLPGAMWYCSFRKDVLRHDWYS